MVGERYSAKPYDTRASQVDILGWLAIAVCLLTLQLLHRADEKGPSDVVLGYLRTARGRRHVHFGAIDNSHGVT